MLSANLFAAAMQKTQQKEGTKMHKYLIWYHKNYKYRLKTLKET